MALSVGQQVVARGFFWGTPSWDLRLFVEWSLQSPDTPNLEKAKAPHSSTLASKIPWMEEPGGLQSMGSLRVRHD